MLAGLFWYIFTAQQIPSWKQTLETIAYLPTSRCTAFVMDVELRLDNALFRMNTTSAFNSRTPPRTERIPGSAVSSCLDDIVPVQIVSSTESMAYAVHWSRNGRQILSHSMSVISGRSSRE